MTHKELLAPGNQALKNAGGPPSHKSCSWPNGLCRSGPEFHCLTQEEDSDHMTRMYRKITE